MTHERAQAIFELLQQRPDGLTLVGIAELTNLTLGHTADGLAKLLREGTLDVRAQWPRRIYRLKGSDERAGGYIMQMIEDER